MKFDFGKISERIHSWMGWGGAAIGGYHLLNSLTGREPPESAGNLAKLAHGGLFSSDDERAMDEIEQELKTDEERELLTGFRTWIRNTYGPGLVGNTLNWLYANRFRSVVVRMRTPEKTKVVSVVTKDAKGKDVVTKSDEPVPADNSKAVDFLSRLAGEIQKGREKTNGSANKKAEAGYRHACAFLQDKSFPVPSFIDRIQSVDAALKGAPARGAVGASAVAKAAATFASETAVSKLQAGAAALTEHSNNHANRQAARTGFVGWLSRVLN
jgi:hypothetical protein